MKLGIGTMSSTEMITPGFDRIDIGSLGANPGWIMPVAIGMNGKPQSTHDEFPIHGIIALAR